MKDENNGKIMSEFIGLKSKMYTIKLHNLNLNYNDVIIKKAKGIKNSALKEITFQNYSDCLFNNINLHVNQKTIKSLKHEVYSIVQKKVALTPFDDKRLVNYMHTDTLPWGYHEK